MCCAACPLCSLTVATTTDLPDANAVLIVTVVRNLVRPDARLVVQHAGRPAGEDSIAALSCVFRSAHKCAGVLVQESCSCMGR
jgi:hypothetical protein